MKLETAVKMHTRPHILVVDDEPQITRVLRTSLNAQGYEIRVANDGETARSTASTRANYPSDGNQQTISKQSANNQQRIIKENQQRNQRISNLYEGFMNQHFFESLRANELFNIGDSFAAYFAFEHQDSALTTNDKYEQESKWRGLPGVSPAQELASSRRRQRLRSNVKVNL